MVVVQAPNPESPPETKLPEPLMIELEGEQYIRFQGAGASQRRMTGTDEMAKVSAAPSSRKTATSGKSKPGALTPVILVYRDGHRADVREYSIVDGILYASGDYWTDGYWEKKIQISQLNVPATIQANQEHGVRFVLPSAPNEVVTRP